VDGACGTSEEKIKAYGNLVGKPGQRPLARLRRVSEDNIKRFLQTQDKIV
jgi:hypothetical protein